MQYCMGLLLFTVGLFTGLKFADFDQTFYWQPLLVHRSLLTHGFLVPLLLFAALRKPNDLRTRWFVMGVCLASAVHLCFDLFPRRWYGFACIHVPFYGPTGAFFSGAWIVLSAVVCLFLACRLIGSLSDLALALGGLIVTYGVSASAEPFQSFFALLVLTTAACVAFLLPNSRTSKDNPSFSLQ